MAKNDLFQINSILLKEDNKQQFDISYIEIINLTREGHQLSPRF
jgi:hypothetical protein